jgi:hypothetical protein
VVSTFEEADMARRLGVGVVLAVVVVALAAPMAADGDGLPIPGVTVAPGGVSTPGSKVHFVAHSKAGRTTVNQIGAYGRTTDSLTLPGRFTVPAVALDGFPGGLSADGRELALIRPRKSFPQSATHLVLLRTSPLRLVRRLDLGGDFSFDAISPDGSRIYLIQYLSRRDPTRYAVRAYDVAAASLARQPIVDRTEPDEQMRGYPLSRVASPDGRWQYTLYSGGEKPFVHALDTGRGRARCIDLPRSIGGVYNDALRIGRGGATLSVSNRNKGTLATVDTSTFKVSTPGTDRSGRASDSTSGGPGDASSLPWVLIGLGVGLALAVASLWGMPRLHRRRLAGGDG